MTELFDFGLFPVLETRRLILRELVTSDAEDIFRIRGDYEVTRYNIGHAYQHLQQAADLISGIADAYQQQMEIRWGITLKGRPFSVIGMCGYNYWNRSDCRASVGYDLARVYWGHGIMTEALGAVVRFGFERMGLNRIEADTDARNGASGRVLAKLGFRHEGTQHEQFFADGAFHDLLLFGLLRSDWDIADLDVDSRSKDS